MDDGPLREIWHAEHRHLTDIAFRMLGDVREAEDIVQEAFARLVRVGLDEVNDPRGWLIVVVGRLCLDTMRSARVRRVSPMGDAGVDRPSDGPLVDPADRVTLDDTVRMAMLVVLERLSPAERTSFVLHDVFQLDFETVASIVGRTPAACRQLARRARRHLADDPEHGLVDVDAPTHREVTERFISACAGGDLRGLMEVLDPDAAGDGAPGGILPPFRPVVGAAVVARNALMMFGPESPTTLMSITIRRQPAIAVTIDHRIAVVVLLEVRDGRIHHLHAVGHPSALPD
jgi:RNA polymerase sigma-70 factor (ECF subfamily)